LWFGGYLESFQGVPDSVKVGDPCARCQSTHRTMTSLKDVDLRLKLSPSEGRERVESAQRRLLSLRLQAGGLIGAGRLGPPLCVLFEGWDAAGKGGSIRRLTSALDPRHVHVAEFAAPSERERRHHFLWRFWPALPGWGGMTVLDRSWYGRVLVERVEGFATEPEWQRAYDEIVGFEQSLCAEGMVLVKLWLQVSEKEQLRRFHARERDPLKRWKLTDDDWRNFSHRAAYERALADMLKRTDHEAAPWRLISAENKPYARAAVLDTVIEALERGLREAGQEPTDDGATRSARG
jgi:AMP-polyphosphate phosphotransferase